MPPVPEANDGRIRTLNLPQLVATIRDSAGEARDDPRVSLNHRTARRKLPIARRTSQRGATRCTRMPSLLTILTVCLIMRILRRGQTVWFVLV